MEIGTVLGWVGNAALLAGVILAGYKHRHAFGLTLIGDVLWFWESCNVGRLDWAAPCVLFGLFAAINWWRWCCADNAAVSEVGSPGAPEPLYPRLYAPVVQDSEDQVRAQSRV